MSQLEKNRRYYDTDGERPQRRRDIRAALKHYTRRAMLGYVILFLAAVGNVYYARYKGDQARDAIVRSGNAVAVVGCNRDFVDREKFRALLRRLKQSTDESFKNGRSTAGQHEAAVKFYTDELGNYTSIDCRASQHTISDNPLARFAEPAPCYVGTDTAVCADRTKP
jgi:hypothetical protein